MSRMPADHDNAPMVRPRSAPPENGLPRPPRFQRGAERTSARLVAASNAVSVIVPTWNCAPFLRPCLNSLLAQTHAPEIIVVDDGSTDGTGEVLSPFRNHIRWIRHPNRRGANAARNTGLRSTAGDWVAFADADAEYRPDWIARLLEAGREDPAVGVVYSRFTKRFEDGATHVFGSRDWDAAALWWDNYVAMPSLVRRDALPAGGLDETSEILDDWQLWLDMCRRGWTGRRVRDSLFLAHSRVDGKTSVSRRDPARRAERIASLRREYASLASLDNKLAVVIPACRSADLTLRCLEHLCRFCGVPFNVFYVDNGSDEATVEAVIDAAEVHDIELHVLRNGHNAGFTPAVNRGIRAAGYRHVLVLNNDCFVGPHCVERLLWAVDRRSDCAAAGPLTGDRGAQSLRRRDVRERAAPQCRILNHLTDPVAASNLLDQRERVARRSMLAFFCTVLNRDAIRRCGLLDERLATGLGADDEWCLRVRRAGWRCLLAFHAYAAHLHSASFRRLGMNYGRLHRDAWKTLREVVGETG